MRIFASLFVAALCAGCGEDTVVTLEDSPDTSVDATSDVVESPPDTTTAEDSSSDTAIAEDSTTPVDSAKPDTGIAFDTGLLEVGGTFSCASSTCSTTLQFCRRATSPGTCPAPDSGICPAGCPGCPALSMSCETMPMKCWAKPSCNCILVELCGSVAKGTCMEQDGGFVAGCSGV